MIMSNELKAVVAVADLQENVGILRDQCMSVQHFSYGCSYRRDDKGRTYRSSLPAMLDFSVRVNAAELARPFYRQMTRNDRCALSFIFNATFTDAKRLDDYADAMVALGYIVDVQEDFRSAAHSGSDEEQILVHVRMQVHSITYVRESETKTLAFVQ